MSDETGAYGPLVESRLSVLTWNVWWRFGPWQERDPAITATLQRIGADVVCLQEVWEESAPGGASQPAVLAAALGFHHVAAYGFEVDGVRFGNAILSRWPITGHEVRSLPAADEPSELRLVLRADIDGPRGPLQVYCTHLNWRFDHSAVRCAQVREIAEFVSQSRPRDYPAVVCGDFNAAPDSDEIRMMTGRSAMGVHNVVFHDAWEVAGDGPGHTWSNDNPYAAADLEPNRRIDYVFAGWPRRGGRGHVVRAALEGVWAVDGIEPSDHYGVLAHLRY